MHNLTEHQSEILKILASPPTEGSVLKNLETCLNLSKKGAVLQRNGLVAKLGCASPFEAVCQGVREDYISLSDPRLQEKAKLISELRFMPLLSLYPKGFFDIAASDAGIDPAVYRDLVREACVILGIHANNRSGEAAPSPLAPVICYMYQQVNQNHNGAMARQHT